MHAGHLHSTINRHRDGIALVSPKSSVLEFLQTHGLRMAHAQVLEHFSCHVDAAHQWLRANKPVNALEMYQALVEGQHAVPPHTELLSQALWSEPTLNGRFKEQLSDAGSALLGIVQHHATPGGCLQADATTEVRRVVLGMSPKTD